LRTALFWVITQRVAGNFLSTFRDNLLVRPLAPRMGPIGCPETSVRHYHHLLRNNPEGRSSQLLSGGSLRSRIERSDAVKAGFVA